MAIVWRSRSRHGKKATNDWAASCCWTPTGLAALVLHGLDPPASENHFPRSGRQPARAVAAQQRQRQSQPGVRRSCWIEQSPRFHRTASPCLWRAHWPSAPAASLSLARRAISNPTDFLSHYCKPSHGLLEYVLRAAINVEHVGKPCDRSSTSRSISGRGRVVSLCSWLTGMDHGYISYMDASNGVPWLIQDFLVDAEVFALR